MRRLVRVVAAMGIAMGGVAVYSTPAIAEGGCGPYSNTVCDVIEFTLCLPDGCHDYELPVYGQILDS